MKYTLYTRYELQFHVNEDDIKNLVAEGEVSDKITDIEQDLRAWLENRLNGTGLKYMLKEVV